MKVATNNPRSHFPFPTVSRWSGLATGQVQVDASLEAQLREDERFDFASLDCWSLGGTIATQPSMDASQPASSSSSSSSLSDLERERVAHVGSLQRAFCEGDTYLVISVPPSWSPEKRPKPFASTRPGVIWQQNQVTLTEMGTAR